MGWCHWRKLDERFHAAGKVSWTEYQREEGNRLRCWTCVCPGKLQRLYVHATGLIQNSYEIGPAQEIAPRLPCHGVIALTQKLAQEPPAIPPPGRANRARGRA